MTFDIAVPASGQSLGSSRSPININFNLLKTTISNASQPNHVDINNTGAGKHIFVQMPVQTTGAANLPAVNEGGLITQTTGGKSELYYARDNTATYIQMTAGTPGTTGLVPNLRGHTFLPGGMILNWGQVSAATPGVDIVFSIAFPTTCWGITLTVVKGTFDTNAIVQDGQTTMTKFRVLTTSGTPPIFFIAIGN